MGLLLKEVLKTLCGVKQWCYACFWKIGYQNPKLLIWEECHYESMACSVLANTSGAENPTLPFGEWEGCFSSEIHSSQLRTQAGDRLHLLINKMMADNQVNVVGEGIVGRAAFTGKHEWILANDYIKAAHPPEVSNEVHHQFSAGMQTIAVIPVRPHGVVQLGSSSAILENIGFVNNVKSLILQLGCVPGALMSDNHIEKEPIEPIGVPVSLGIPFPMCFPGNYKVPNSSPFLADSCNKQMVSSQEASRMVGEASCSQIRQLLDNQCATASAIHIPTVTKTFSKACVGSREPKIAPLMKPDTPFMGQLENGVVGAEVIPLNPGAWLNHHSASCNSRSGFNHQPITSQSDTSNSIVKLLEQQILADVGFQSHVNNNRTVPDNFNMPHRKTNDAKSLSSHGGSRMSGGQLLNEVGAQTRATSIPYHPFKQQKSADNNHSSELLAGAGIQNADSLRAEEVHLSSLFNQLSASATLSQGADHKYHSADVKPTKNEAIAIEKKMDGDLFQAFNILHTQQDGQAYLGEYTTGSINSCLKNASASQSAVTASSKSEDPCAKPLCGDDLYDVLGVDFKNRLLNSNWNNLLGDEPYVKAQDMVKDESTFVNMQERSSDLYSLNEGISDSNIFSEMATDHLLDAVVSRAHSAAKQSSDDNVSCGTTLTKISSSSLPIGSSSYGRIGISDQVQRELFGIPKSLEKAVTMASSSLLSGCSKDNIGSSSQTTSIYGSQLSSWVEQGHNVRHDGSVSTAFSKKNDETSKPNRKRLKPGENPRPRPKDRQMIQDRVKELREIVPNGAKCSIDSLLERTIKHMLFLQSVTKHADKLKQTAESKIINKDGGLLLKDNFDGGATWAFEVGSQSMVCPIIVEDLNPPRQMLVEMLCEERGFFLEIADLIRGMGLTILKGVMETQNDKIWARFAVEAKRDVTRMEIFMSLVQLLEQTVKGSASPAAALENGNMMVHHSFPQATSIPATGMPSSLQ